MTRHTRDGGDYGDEVYDDTGAENVPAAELLDLITAGGMVVAQGIGDNGELTGQWAMFTPVSRDPRGPRG